MIEDEDYLLCAQKSDFEARPSALSYSPKNVDCGPIEDGVEQDACRSPQT